MNYNNKRFRPIASSANSETDSETVFHYQQTGNILTATYQSRAIQFGQLLGIVDELGKIEMRYHQINSAGKFMTGTCTSIAEILPTGKIRLHETWKWTSGDFSEGTSILEEM